MNPSIYAYTRFRAGGDAPGPLLYARGNIVIAADQITLRAYYMPTGAPRTIRFWEVCAVEEVDLTFWGCKGWGSGVDCRVWWHWDWCLRPFSKKRKRGIVLHTRAGGFAAGLSPRAKDYDLVLRLIQDRVEAETQKLSTRHREARGRAGPVASDGADAGICTADIKETAIDSAAEFTSAPCYARSEPLYPAPDARPCSSLQ
jgi:hypothetical protein